MGRRSVLASHPTASDMKLHQLQRQWDRLGKRDPLWAVLTVPEYKHGKWDVDEFFRTGREEIEAVLERARLAFGLPLASSRALDFGSGLGRLTQAMLDSFVSCDGVDIAPSMLETAARYNRDPARCRYHLNVAPDLRLFADRSFSFVYSLLVLQHIPPDQSKTYIREFLRVLEWGGLLVFHVPSHDFPGEPESGSRWSAPSGPLPDSAFRARIVDGEVGSVVGFAGETLTLKVRVRNLGDTAWPAGDGGRRTPRVHLGGHFIDAHGRILADEGERARLPRDVEAQEEVELFFPVRLPAEAGDYRLELDMVQEGVGWFAERGSEIRSVRLRVERGAGASNAAPPTARRRPAASSRVPFKDSHPELHHVLGATGALAVLRLFRESRARVAAGIEDLRRRGRGRARSRPIMDMHAVPRPEVLELIRAGGGLLLDCEALEEVRAGYQSYRYWVTVADGLDLDSLKRGRRAVSADLEVRWSGGGTPASPGAPLSVPVRVSNLGSLRWRAAGQEGERGATYLGGHLLRDGDVVDWDFLRTCLPADLPPGASVDLDCRFRAPSETGSWLLRLDMVIEGVCWFRHHGSPERDVVLEVAEAPSALV